MSPLGHDTLSYWSGLAAGTSGIAQPTLVDPELLQGEVVAEVKDYNAADHFDERQLAPLDRVSQFAIVAARQAIAQSGLELGNGLSERTATIVGTGIGGSTTLDESYKRLYGEDAKRIYPLTVPKLMPNAPASQVSMHCGLRGRLSVWSAPAPLPPTRSAPLFKWSVRGSPRLRSPAARKPVSISAR